MVDFSGGGGDDRRLIFSTAGSELDRGHPVYRPRLVVWLAEGPLVFDTHGVDRHRVGLVLPCDGDCRYGMDGDDVGAFEPELFFAFSNRRFLGVLAFVDSTLRDLRAWPSEFRVTRYHEHHQSSTVRLDDERDDPCLMLRRCFCEFDDFHMSIYAELF